MAKIQGKFGLRLLIAFILVAMLYLLIGFGTYPRSKGKLGHQRENARSPASDKEARRAADPRKAGPPE